MRARFRLGKAIDAKISNEGEISGFKTGFHDLSGRVFAVDIGTDTIRRSTDISATVTCVQYGRRIAIRLPPWYCRARKKRVTS